MKSDETYGECRCGRSNDNPDGDCSICCQEWGCWDYLDEDAEGRCRICGGHPDHQEGSELCCAIAERRGRVSRDA